MIVVLVGPHGVGKTSLARRLAALLSLPFHEEIGRTLAEDPRWRPSGHTAAMGAERFDGELFRRERARDMSSLGLARVVETWHPGNLAFARRRSPTVVAAWWPLLQSALAELPVLVQPLVASPETLAARQTEPGDLRFFLEVGLAAQEEAARLGLRCLPPLCTDESPPDRLAAELARRITASNSPSFPFSPSLQTRQGAS